MFLLFPVTYSVISIARNIRSLKLLSFEPSLFNFKCYIINFKVWDVRNAQCTKTFEPHKNCKLQRPQIGKWISCVSIDSNSQWMACGGGPHSSLWHLRSGNLISTLPDNLKVSTNCLFLQLVKLHFYLVSIAPVGSNLL